jgi:CheY-like chemotaxis protein
LRLLGREDAGFEASVSGLVSHFAEPDASRLNQGLCGLQFTPGTFHGSFTLRPLGGVAEVPVALCAASRQDEGAEVAVWGVFTTSGRRCEAPVPVQEAPRARRILVADDDPVNRRLADMMLTRAGHAATVVDSGEAALAALRCARFDVILLDVEMPGLSGPETALRIRVECPPGPGPCTAILALTGHCGPQERSRCLQSGMDAVLVKPLSLEALSPWLNQDAPALKPGAAGQGPLHASSGVKPERSRGPVPQGLAQEGSPEAPLAPGRPLNRGFLGGVLRVFLEDAPRKMAALQQTDDFDEALRLARTLAGAASEAGAAQLADICREVIAAARAQDMTGLRGAAGRAESALSRALEEARTSLAALR